jgi:glycosyltransferase involved in cell wall biosynthesis
MMKLLIFHPVKLPVLQYGGTERVVMWLAQTLSRMGHEISVFAAPGSTMPAGIECITDESILFKKSKDFDVIHGFTRISPELEAEAMGKILVTVQGNGQLGETFHRNTVFVSRNHAKRHGADAFVYNGLDPDELKYSAGPRPNRFLFLSKTSWRVKNLKGASRFASQTKQNLWIAGGDRPYSQRLKVAAQKLIGRDWNWVGSVDQAQKANFLIEGKAMLFPLLWNEPFGIVMTESLVSGTPVFAHAYGSVPEVLEFAPECLLKSDEDWKAALTGQIRMPDAKICRDWVLSKFDQVNMAKHYLKLYEDVASGKSLNAREPKTLIGAEEI